MSEITKSTEEKVTKIASIPQGTDTGGDITNVSNQVSKQILSDVVLLEENEKIKRIYDGLVASGFAEIFNQQQDAPFISRLYAFDIIKFKSLDLKEAIKQLLEKGIPEEKIKDELSKRIQFNTNRLRNIEETNPEDFAFEGEYAIDGNDIDLSLLYHKLRTQIPTNIIKQCFIPKVVFSKNLLISDKEGVSQEISKEEAMKRENWSEIERFKSGNRDISQYGGNMAGLPFLIRPIKIYNLDGRPEQRHLEGISNWQTREVYGLILHEMAHALETLWTKKQFDEWLDILEEEAHEERLTIYLDEYKNGTRKTTYPLNHREEFADTLKVFCINTQYLQQRSPKRYAFIKKYYPDILNSDAIWD